MPKDELHARHGPSKFAYVFGFFPVIIVIILLAWSYRAYVFKMSLGYLWKQHPAQAILYAFFYHVFAILTVWSYWKILVTPTGSPLDIPHLRISEEEMSRLEVERHQDQSRPLETPPRRHAPVNGLEESQMLLVDEEDEEMEQDLEFGVGTDNINYATRLQTVTVKADGKRRYCKKCMCWKPDRTHHCKLCHRCILKMDHHCPWINTCVNWTNYKYFIVFITNAAILTTFIAISTIPVLLEYVQIDGHSTSIDFNALEWAFLVLIGAMFGIILIGFTVYHYSLLLRNMTTIESMERGNFWDEQLGGDISLRGYASKKRINVFDLGRLENVKQVMGPHWYLWLVPIKTWKGDGTKFPINTRFRE